MTISRAGLALGVIAAACAASGGNAQIVENSRHQERNISTLRIAPLVGQGPVQNVVDLLNAKGVDAAIVPSDVLPYLRDGRLSAAGSSLAYVKKIDQEQVHILARRDITSIVELAGKKVNFDLRDSRAFITGSVLFRSLKINVQPVSSDQPRALQQLRRGEIAAIVDVGKSPARLFFDLNRDDGVHFLPVPFTEEVSRTYLPARLAPVDYPLLIGGGEVGRGAPVATVAVPIVLAVNSRALQSEGHRNMSQLIDTTSSRVVAQHGLSSASVSRPEQTTEVPGWQRFVPRTQPAPQPTLRAMQHHKGEASLSSRLRQQRFSAEPRQSDEQRLNEKAQSGSSTTDTTAGRAYIAQQQRTLLREFLRWREPFSPNKEPPQPTEDVFDEFMRSRGKH
jgi:uncharacterized protein